MFRRGGRGVADFLSGLAGDGDLYGNIDEKLTHDAYDVLVNGEFIGTKIVSWGEEGACSAVDSLLKNRGYHGYELAKDGNQVELAINQDAAPRVKEELRVWLNIK